ncbi:hypothetical protein GCM10012275_23020 [Longimycelium tulufanense]|uniref:ESAT-6-like protein n=1 Tax=Longimycelium tulufanense TaxID=907463 RepID=A0A8J3CD75_9PSEU|nr:WXG100 family type VII secretion target [Longimycelium tulufanense]GGM51531.1 hypothetical protein GCM10012275_23020 [Longimycelium tulufanense]
MAGSYTTDSATMQQAGNDIANTNQEIQGLLSNLRGQIEPLQSAWKGQAATAFHNLMERWNTDAKKLNDALMAISEMMGASAKSYVQQEEEQSQSMNSILGALGG